jgi:hypothetical protein
MLQSKEKAGNSEAIDPVKVKSVPPSLFSEAN